jgi:protein-L-isoaspartate(D-aspartate) O-methyltransferase
VEEVAAIAGLRSTALRQALGVVRREAFLPPGPWNIETLDGSYYPTEDALVPRVLHAVGVCLDIGRGLNSANPAKICRLLEAVEIEPGETVLHIGAGLGYYSALIAELVGREGRVIAAEIDPRLRQQAEVNLAPFANVTVVADAQSVTLPPLDVVFASAGMASIPRLWTDPLRPGGRLLLPLTGALNSGYVFLFQKTDTPSRYLGHRCTFSQFFPCLGLRDQPAMRALDAALADRRIDLARRLTLRLDGHPPDSDCWLHLPDYCIGLEM